MTTLTKFNAFPGLKSMMEDFWNPELFLGNPLSGRQFMPAVNIKDTKNGFQMELAAPGFKKEDFKIETESGLLTISGETRAEDREEEENYSRKEFSMSAFKRTFRLPEDISQEHVSASYRDGLLILDLKSNGKKTTPKKQIAIK